MNDEKIKIKTENGQTLEVVVLNKRDLVSDRDAADCGPDLVDQILTYSRSQRAARGPVEIGRIVGETLEVIRGSLPDGTSLEVSLPAVPLTVFGDPTQLHQVFMNLGANAGHAIGSRGGELEVKIHRIKRPPGAGLGSSSAFGGPCHTPNFEKLAASGLKYTRFHTTALCSPTRAALLSGRNHHTVGMGAITEFATSAPGQNSSTSTGSR